jgi:hypothetical protein
MVITLLGSAVVDDPKCGGAQKGAACIKVSYASGVLRWCQTKGVGAHYQCEMGQELMCAKRCECFSPLEAGLPFANAHHSNGGGA